MKQILKLVTDLISVSSIAFHHTQTRVKTPCSHFLHSTPTHPKTRTYLHTKVDDIESSSSTHSPSTTSPPKHTDTHTHTHTHTHTYILMKSRRRGFWWHLSFPMRCSFHSPSTYRHTDTHTYWGREVVEGSDGTHPSPWGAPSTHPRTPWCWSDTADSGSFRPRQLRNTKQ